MKEETIILDYCENFIDEIEVNEDELHDYDEAIKATENLRIKNELYRLKEQYEMNAQAEDGSFWYNEELKNIDEATSHLSEHITHADIGRWDGHHIHDEETEESYTLREAVDKMSGCDDVRIFTKDGEVYLDGIHHDVRNVYRWGHKMAKQIEELVLGK